MEGNDAPGAWHVWTPGARLAGFLKRSTIHWYTHREKKKKALDLNACPIASLWEPMIHGVGVIFDPRGMIPRIYVKLHITMLHTKYRSLSSCGFREDFYMYFPL